MIPGPAQLQTQHLKAGTQRDELVLGDTLLAQILISDELNTFTPGIPVTPFSHIPVFHDFIFQEKTNKLVQYFCNGTVCGSNYSTLAKMSYICTLAKMSYICTFVLVKQCKSTNTEAALADGGRRVAGYCECDYQEEVRRQYSG